MKINHDKPGHLHIPFTSASMDIHVSQIDKVAD